MTSPEYVVFAMLDEPRGTDDTFGYATGGWVAAPLVGRVIEQMGPMVGILPVDPESPEILEAMHVDLPGANRPPAPHSPHTRTDGVDDRNAHRSRR